VFVLSTDDDDDAVVVCDVDVHAIRRDETKTSRWTE